MRNTNIGASILQNYNPLKQVCGQAPIMKLVLYEAQGPAVQDYSIRW